MTDPFDILLIFLVSIIEDNVSPSSLPYSLISTSGARFACLLRSFPKAAGRVAVGFSVDSRFHDLTSPVWDESYNGESGDDPSESRNCRRAGIAPRI